MTKKMTLKKQEFSLSDMPVFKIRNKNGHFKSSAATRLKDKELIFKALWQCLVEKDIDSFKEILKAHLEVCNKQQITKKSKVSMRTLYRILSPEGNPTLKNISNVIHAIYG